MVKRITGLLAMLMCIFMMQAQGMGELPLNPNVRHGVLPNKMSYYILHNEEPKGHANFYIAQKVGSTLETKEQLGLAHFLEHMAFNGSTNFPGKSMLEYLQAKGVRFGQDINAYTSFDETVYRINNVPTSDVPLMDSVLLVLHDWSSDLLLEDAEIDAERGVIQEEWRTRNNAQTRMMTSLLSQVYDEYQYTQMPIGTMDVVMNFPYQVLRDYYHKWYRPDQQGIVIVGDFDVDEMEKKVIKLMGSINMPENAAPRTYPVVSDNKGLRYASFTDPELQNQIVMFSVKYDKTPFEMRSDLSYYIQDNVVETLISTMLNTRLNDLTQKPGCAFAFAGASFGDFIVAKTKGAFNLTIVPNTDPKAAFNEAFSEVMRACKTGFTASELERAKEEMKASYEKAYNERNKTNSDALAQELIRKFIDNEPAPGIETEWQLINMILPQITVDALNPVLQQVITPDNQVLFVSMPQVEGTVVPTKDEMVQVISSTMNKEYEAYVDDVINEPLIAERPKKGSIKATKELPEFGATMLTLSNGAKVYVKTTDFAADQILFAAVSDFGKLSYSEQDDDEALIYALACENSNLGNFSPTQLQKALAGKKVGSSYFLSNYTNGLQGSTTVKDLESLMQVVYLQFTALNPNEETYSAVATQYANVLANQESTPDYVFGKAISDTRYNHNKLMQQVGSKHFKEADYKKMIDMARKNMSNAADFDFIFVGNVDVATLKPLLEQYIASLPGKANASNKRKNNILNYPKGAIENPITLPMESPQTKEFVMVSGNDIPYSIENDVKLDFVGKILDIIYTRTLREEIGGTYGASVYGAISPRNNEWFLLYAYDTGADTKKALNDRAISDLDNLISKGAPVEDFNKVKEAAMTQYGLNIKKNNYWLDALMTYSSLGINTDKGYEQAVKSLTVNDLNAFMKKLNVKKNRMHVVVDGVAK